jgi:hypothetical protein
MTTRLVQYLGCDLTIKGRVLWTVFIVNFVSMLTLLRYDILFAIIVGFSGLAILRVRTSRRRLPYPPGPWRLPVLGNLFSMPSQEEWVTYRKWSKDCGKGRPVQARSIHRICPLLSLFSGSDVIHVDVMGYHIIILNSIKSANELLEKKSSIYSDRYDRYRPAGYFIDKSKRDAFQATS